MQNHNLLQKGLRQGDIAWTYGAEATGSWENKSAPIMGTDGTEHIGYAKGLIVLHLASKPTSRYETAGPMGTPALAPDGTIYIGSQNGFFYALNPGRHLEMAFLYRRYQHLAGHRR